MKKLRRNLFSGLYLFIVLMILEVIAIIFVQFFLDIVFEELSIDQKWVSVFWASVKLLEMIFVIVLYYKILCRYEDPEFKIAWLIGLVSLPLFVTMLYLFFGRRGISHKEEHVIELSRATYYPYLKAHHAINKDKETDLGRGIGAFNYIRNTSGMGFHSHNKIEYYKNGETFFP